MCAPVERRLGVNGIFLAAAASSGFDVAVLSHLADDPVAPLGGFCFVLEGMVVVRRFWKRREIGRLFNRQIVQALC